MTTTVTVKTHGRPAMVTVANEYDFRSQTASGHGHSIAHNFVGTEQSAEFVVTDTQTVTVEELAEGATGLPGFVEPDAESPNVPEVSTDSGL